MHGWVLFLMIGGVIAWAAMWYALGRIDGNFDVKADTIRKLRR